MVIDQQPIQVLGYAGLVDVPTLRRVRGEAVGYPGLGKLTALGHIEPGGYIGKIRRGKMFRGLAGERRGGSRQRRPQPPEPRPGR